MISRTWRADTRRNLRALPVHHIKTRRVSQRNRLKRCQQLQGWVFCKEFSENKKNKQRRKSQLIFPGSISRATKLISQHILRFLQELWSANSMPWTEGQGCYLASKDSKSGLLSLWSEDGSLGVFPSLPTDWRVMTWSLWREKSMKSSRRRRK